MNKKPLRLGCIGAGNIGRNVHIPGVVSSPDLELAALCDADADSLQSAAAAYGIGDAWCFTGYNDLINCKDVDVVDICTPNDSHYAIAKAAIAAGKPYCLEKPVAFNVTEADELVRLTAEKKLPNMVCFSYRFKASARYARYLVRSGAIGEIRHIYMQYFFGVNPPRPYQWRQQKDRAGTGIVSDLGCHAVDMTRFITGCEFKRAVGMLGTYIKEKPLKDGSGMGKVEVDDYAHFMAYMDNGAAASYQLTMNAYGHFNFQRFEFYGTRGGIIYIQNHELKYTSGEDKDEIYVCAGEPYASAYRYAELPVPAQYQGDQMQSFADLVNGRGDGLAATIQEGRDAQYVIDKVIESTKTGSWADL